jgi:predicted XRE-type DNA-binding protein
MGGFHAVVPALAMAFLSSSDLLPSTRRTRKRRTAAGARPALLPQGHAEDEQSKLDACFEALSGPGEGTAVMTEQTFASAWDAIEDTPAEAEDMKLRSTLMMALERHIRSKRWTQAEAARRLGVTQPRLSDLLRGKIDLFSLDTLVNILAAAGLQVEISVRKAA